ncbi:MAG: GAF domain-containing protein [Candidatus Hydrogenedentes bacterium]|nr:GAF domain-containing protein [Candidatus Hydrogenedentota bacterium]
MTYFEIILHRPGQISKRYRVQQSGIMVGRSSNCHITLSDQLVSRRHARLWLEGDALHVRDMDSRNGIEVNGVKTLEAALKEGDMIQVGDATMEVARYSDSTLGQTVITYEEATALCDAMGSDSSVRMPYLYRAARLLGTVFDDDELLRQILDLIFEALPVRRGFILTRTGAGDEPEVRAQRSFESEGGPPLSSTLIEMVLREKQSLLTADAKEDSRFDGAASIMGHHIHAAMCSPLCGREEVVGAIYVDAGTTSATFSQADLELLTAITRVVGVAVENSRLYQQHVAQERLAAIGEATAGLGHCIKNIMTGIRGGAEYVDIALQKGDIKYLERAWPIMSRAIQRIDMLVMNLLTFSRERVPERTPTNITGLVQDVLEVVRSRAEKCNVALELVPGTTGIVAVDGREIYRVILNLVTNAVDACEKAGGTVRVRCASEGGGCMIAVEDSGTGIPPEILPKLSHAFVSTKGSAGTGLGLACSYKIVREHGGTIEVQSKVGEGTLFTVYLPGDGMNPRSSQKLTSMNA